MTALLAGACALVAIAIAAPAHAVLLDRVVAVVGRDAITWLELNASLKRELGPRFAELTAEQQRTVLTQREAEYLEVMIDKRLQIQEAERMGMVATDEDVADAVEGIRAKYGLGPDEFRAAIRSEGLEWDQYTAMLRDQITVSRVVDRAVRAKVREDSADLPAGGQVSYRLRQIFFPVADEPGAEAAVRPKVERVMQALQAGREFKDVATEYSEGPAAKRGGDLGEIPADRLAPEFIKAIEGLSVGQVSDPFRTRRGVHIVLVEDHIDPRTATLNKLFEDRYRAWLKDLRDRSNVEIRL
jgi:peptidyl-prolyl cis-trans isomerase SurA